MTKILEFSEIESLIHSEKLVLFYLTRPGCGVCTALKPKVISLIDRFPELKAFSVDLDAIPEAAGQLSIFTLPGLLVYAEGKESIREARYISMDLLEDQLTRIYSMLFAND